MCCAVLSWVGREKEKSPLLFRLRSFSIRFVLDAPFRRRQVGHTGRPLAAQYVPRPPVGVQFALDGHGLSQRTFHLSSDAQTIMDSFSRRSRMKRRLAYGPNRMAARATPSVVSHWAPGLSSFLPR